MTKNVYFEPEHYIGQIKCQLRRNATTSDPQAPEDGAYDQAADIARRVCDRVNAALQAADEASKDFGFVDRVKAMRTAQVFAESDAVRDALPWDPEELKLIGPNGGYMDRDGD